MVGEMGPLGRVAPLTAAEEKEARAGSAGTCVRCKIGKLEIINHDHNHKANEAHQIDLGAELVGEMGPLGRVAPLTAAEEKEA